MLKNMADDSTAAAVASELNSISTELELTNNTTNHIMYRYWIDFSYHYT